MKKSTMIFTVLLAMAVLFASCSNGGGSSESASASKVSAVPVTLTLGGEAEKIAQKSVVLNAAADSLTYWVQATPLWTGTNIQNAKATLTQITYVDGVSLGYFTPGAWTFYVEIKNGENVIYTGTATPVYISTSDAAVAVDMALKDSDASGSVTIKVAVPKVSASGTTVTVAYGDVAEAAVSAATADTTVSTAGVTSASDNWCYFTNTYSDLAPGNYTFTLKYKDGSNVIGGATVAFTVRNGDAYGIYGTIENGQYQIANLTLNMPTVTLIPSEMAYSAPVASITAIDGATYAWTVNGAAATAAASSNEYSFGTNYTTPGVYHVVCKVTKDGAIGYSERDITVNP